MLGEISVGLDGKQIHGRAADSAGTASEASCVFPVKAMRITSCDGSFYVSM